MQLEITLTTTADNSYLASDLGFLLHKNPARVFARSVASGEARVFYTESTDERCTAVPHVDVDTVALVRGKNKHVSGMLDQYVNDRPYVASSLLSAAMTKCYAQSMSGRSKERQALADSDLTLQAKVTPVSCSGGEAFLSSLFTPLGYECSVTSLGGPENRLYEFTLAGHVKLSDLLTHLYVLIPVLDDSKHWWVDRDEVEKLLDKGGLWLANHPEKDLISRRALKYRQDLSDELLERLAGIGHDEASSASNAIDVQASGEAPADREENLEKPIRLHDQRLDRVATLLLQNGARRVLDIGCGEGKLIKRLLREQRITQILGVDPSLRSLKRARERFFLNDAGEALRERLQFQLGSLTYADRRLRRFDAATLVEVIEHIEPTRLPALERSLFGDAMPSMIIITTPNADYNALFGSLSAGEFRHEDHRFEWSRAEFATWSERVAQDHGYSVETEPLGPVDSTHGAPSQLARFIRLNQDADAA